MIWSLHCFKIGKMSKLCGRLFSLQSVWLKQIIISVKITSGCDWISTKKWNLIIEILIANMVSPPGVLYVTKGQIVLFSGNVLCPWYLFKKIVGNLPCKFFPKCLPWSFILKVLPLIPCRSRRFFTGTGYIEHLHKVSMDFPTCEGDAANLLKFCLKRDLLGHFTNKLYKRRKVGMAKIGRRIVAEEVIKNGSTKGLRSTRSI